MKGYKIFNADMTCRGFQYEIGKTYTHKGSIGLCESGFHFCKELKSVYNYYDFDYKLPVCEVEAVGDTETNKDKSVTNKLKIIRRLTIEEVLQGLNLFCSSNRGSSNSGSDNRGSYNRGSDNRGSYNRGSSNSGSYNSGIYNFGSYSVGIFNTKSFIGESNNCCCFNKKTGMSLIQFYRKYMTILKEIRSYNFSNVSDLSNYNKELFDKIRQYI